MTDDTSDTEGRRGDRGTGLSIPDSRTGPPPIAAHQSDGSHTVFTERGISDAWIATDVVVSVRR